MSELFKLLCICLYVKISAICVQCSCSAIYYCSGLKATYWEGGMRATGFIWSPLLKKAKRVSNQMMHVTDWLPTIMHIAGKYEFDTTR